MPSSLKCGAIPETAIERRRRGPLLVVQRVDRDEPAESEPEEGLLVESPEACRRCVETVEDLARRADATGVAVGAGERRPVRQYRGNTQRGDDDEPGAVPAGDDRAEEQDDGEGQIDDARVGQEHRIRNPAATRPAVRRAARCVSTRVARNIAQAKPIRMMMPLTTGWFGTPLARPTQFGSSMM